jgi:hypothetical protein
MSRTGFFVSFIATLLLPTIASSQSFLSQYKGEPYHDSRYNGGAQKIPGKVLCAYYDLGGEGVAYLDTDPKNHGSGELNPADGNYLNEFRIHEGVDTSYTKFNRKPDPIDDNSFDKIRAMPNRTEARPAKAARTNATGRLPLLRLFSTPLIAPQ